MCALPAAAALVLACLLPWQQPPTARTAPKLISLPPHNPPPLCNTLAFPPGSYAIPELERRGAQLVLVSGPAEAAAAIAAGKAVAFADDNTDLNQSAGLGLAPSPAPILVAPYGLAVQKGDVALQDRYSWGGAGCGTGHASGACMACWASCLAGVCCVVRCLQPNFVTHILLQAVQGAVGPGGWRPELHPAGH